MVSKKSSINFRSFYYSSYIGLQLGGVWFFTKNTTTLKYKLYCIFSNTFSFFLNFLQLMEYILNLNLENFAKILYVLPTTCMGSVETYFLFKYRTEISTLITQLSQERFQPKNSKQIEIAEEAIKPYTIIRILLQTIIFFSGIFLYISPLATLKTEKSFPYNCWYPFNVSKSPLYELAYIQQVLGGLYITITKLSTILFLGGIQLYLGVQCDFLCHKIESLGGPYFGRNLKKCILYHESILKLAALTQKIFNGIYLGEFCTCCTALSITLLLLSTYKKVDADVLFLSGFQLAIMLFLFYYSWFATEVTKKSENIAFAAYSCDWMGKSKEFQKDIMYLIQISQKPIKFHIHGLIGVSSETFLKVLKSSFSYYTVLKNVMQD